MTFKGYMKKITAIITALSTGAALTGCTFGASIDTLMTPPKLSVEQEQIYSKLTDPTGASAISLKYPKSGKYLSAFIIEDIDDDGGNEAIVFYERKNHAADENPLRINVLDKEGDEWKSVYDTAAEGSEIEEVIISKLGSNKRTNIIVGTSIINRSEKNVSIYNYSNGELMKQIFDAPASSDEPYSFIGVKDLDSDGQNEFLRFTGASNGIPATANVYTLDKNGNFNNASIGLSENFGDLTINYGRLPDGNTGIYIDAVSGTGTIQSDVVYMQDGSLQRFFSTPEEASVTERSAGCTCFDVDGDGSIEIPVQKAAPGYEYSDDSEKMKLTEWMKINSDMKLQRCYVSYYSLNDGYIFIFPDRWVGKVTMKSDLINDEIVFCAYDKKIIGRDLLNIFCAGDAPSREDRLMGGYMLMHTKGDSSYLAHISDAPDTGDGLSITAGEAAICFRTRD
jgi:hypothetical protein